VERRAFRVPGFLALLFLVAVIGAAVWVSVDPGSFRSVGDRRIAYAAVAGGLVFVLMVSGFVVVNPNEARVVQFFGRYIGSIRAAGFHWTVPFTTQRGISLRVRNFESARLKVSDADGNPVEIAAVVVYRVFDSAKAMFAVDDYMRYVAVQAETAVRHLATSYPYEAHDSGRASLRDSAVVSQETHHGAARAGRARRGGDHGIPGHPSRVRA